MDKDLLEISDSWKICHIDQLNKNEIFIFVEEQKHVSTSITKRFHHEFGARSVCFRAGLHMMTPLFPPPKPEEKVVAKSEVKLVKAIASQPQKAAARHMFFNHLMLVKKFMNVLKDVFILVIIHVLA